MADLAGAGLWLEQELTQYDPRWYKTVFPERWAAMGKYHSARGDLQLGEKRVVVGRIEAAGRAVIHSGRATDIPLIKLGATADQYNARIIIMRGEWDSIADIAAQNVANANGLLPRRNIVEQIMSGLAEKIAEREHELIVFGERAEGMDGMFSGTGVETLRIPPGTHLHTMAPLPLFDLIRGCLKRYHKRSMLTAIAMRMLCTIDLYDALCQKFPDSEGTPLERLTREGRGMFVREIVPVNELSSAMLEQSGVQAPGTNCDRFMLYEDRPTVEGEIVQPSLVRQFYALDRTPVRQSSDTAWSVTAFSATTEMQFRRPYAALYYDYDKFVEPEA